MMKIIMDFLMAFTGADFSSEEKKNENKVKKNLNEKNEKPSSTDQDKSREADKK